MAHAPDNRHGQQDQGGPEPHRRFTIQLDNRSEGLWTVDIVLDLLVGRVLSVLVEPRDVVESRGVELVAARPDGTREYHSVKRQMARVEWRLTVA